jgi:hypothetical protein
MKCIRTTYADFQSSALLLISGVTSTRSSCCYCCLLGLKVLNSDFNRVRCYVIWGLHAWHRLWHASTNDSIPERLHTILPSFFHILILSSYQRSALTRVRAIYWELDEFRMGRGVGGELYLPGAAPAGCLGPANTHAWRNAIRSLGMQTHCSQHFGPYYITVHSLSQQYDTTFQHIPVPSLEVPQTK